MNSNEKKAFKLCCQGSEDAFSQLVPLKVKVNHQIPTIEFNHIILENPSMLHTATVHQRDRIAQLLIDLGISLDLRDAKGRTAVCLACIYGSTKILGILIDSGADPFLNDFNGYSPLHWAVLKNQQSCAEILIQAGAIVSSHNFAYREPLHCAARQGFPDFIHYLVQQGADVNALTVDHRTPLLEATCGTDDDGKNGKLSTVTALLSKKADPRIADLSGRSPLHWAALYGHEKIIRQLLAAGANPKAADDEGVTALHLASLAGSIDGVQQLVEAGAFVDAIDKFQRTSMHYAIRGQSQNVIRYLRDNRANLDATDEDGVTPAMLVEGPASNEIMEILQRNPETNVPSQKMKSTSSKHSSVNMRF